MDKRTRARELAIQALYQLDVQGEDVFKWLSDFFKENEPDMGICKLAASWTKGVWQNLKVCDQAISESVIRWDISRIAIVDKSILRLSVYHLKFCQDIPPKVVINEAVELAKRFGTAHSAKFVNGVVDAVFRKSKQNN